MGNRNGNRVPLYPVPGDNSIMPRATTTHLQLLTMMEFYDKSAFSKNVLSPLPIKQKKYQVDSNNNNLGESNMIEEKVIKNPHLLGE